MISREQIVEESVERFTRDLLVARGYGADQVELVDEFPAGKGKLDKTYVAAGFNFDGQGEGAELGSDLMRRTHTVEFFVFGTTMTWAKNVSSALKYGLQSDPNGRLPLYDLETWAVADYLLDVSATSERQPVPNPEPWQEHVYTVHLKVTDEYHASLVV